MTWKENVYIFRGALRFLLYTSGVLLGISFICFSVSAITPGDPAEIILRSMGDEPSYERIMALRKELGLEGSFWERYISWLLNAIRGDFGRSYKTGEAVIREIAGHMPATIELSFAAFSFIVIISTAIGIWSAIRQNRTLDRIGQAFAVFFLSIPNFWLGIILIFLFALKLKWFPVLFTGSISDLVLPVLTLGIPISALQGRVLRASIVEVLGQDYVRFAMAKGLRSWSIIRRHVLRNALPSILTLWGISLGHLLGGSFIVESIFSWPGLGKLAVDAVLSRDIPVVQGAVLIMAFVFMVTTRIIDLIVGILDPRVRVHLKMKGWRSFDSI